VTITDKHEKRSADNKGGENNISSLKGIFQRKLTGVKKSSNDRYSFGDGVLGILFLF
jgi:hypothetical protein